jgi:ABC-type uncharacterized transport system auxiliary subunit
VSTSTHKPLVHGFAALAIALSGCFGTPARDESFYSLKGPSEGFREGNGPKLQVAEFSAAAGFETPRIAYRNQNNVLRYYGYRLWVADPARMVSEMVTQHLRASGLFKQVDKGDAVRDPDYVLEGQLEALEEVDQAKTWSARLALHWRLRSRSDALVLEHAFDRSLPCPERRPSQVASVLSKILAEEAAALVQRITKLTAVDSTSKPAPEQPTGN